MKITVVFLWLIGSYLGAGSIQNDRDFQQGVEKMGNEEKLLRMIYTAADFGREGNVPLKYSILMVQKL